MQPNENTPAILSILQRTYLGIGPALHFNSPFQLLVAVILSAQTNDNQVNKITDTLFNRFDSPAEFAALTAEELESWIKTCGLYKMKAAHIIAASRIIIEKFAGEVPQTREELLILPGVGRKTANVVLANAFSIPALAVDTHVFRVAHRLGLSDARTADQTEDQLVQIIPEDQWSDAHHWLIWHGRKVCMAKKPACETCPVKQYCPSSIWKGDMKS